jgi:hypothetical protein
MSQDFVCEYCGLVYDRGGYHQHQARQECSVRTLREIIDEKLVALAAISSTRSIKRAHAIARGAL